KQEFPGVTFGPGQLIDANQLKEQFQGMIRRLADGGARFYGGTPFWEWPKTDDFTNSPSLIHWPKPFPRADSDSANTTHEPNRLKPVGHGRWVEIREAAREDAREAANEVLKAVKEALQGKGTRSGKGGKPFTIAAARLRELLKGISKDLAPEYQEAYKEEIQKKITEWTAKKEISHPVK